MDKTNKTGNENTKRKDKSDKIKTPNKPTKGKRHEIEKRTSEKKRRYTHTQTDLTHFKPSVKNPN